MYTTSASVIPWPWYKLLVQVYTCIYTALPTFVSWTPKCHFSTSFVVTSF